jgi:hypothetical protein
MDFALTEDQRAFQATGQVLVQALRMFPGIKLMPTYAA